MIEGGTAPNIVPRSCDIRWQMRSLPSSDADAVPFAITSYAQEQLLPEMRKVAPNATIETESHTAVPAFSAGPNSDAVALAMALTGANGTSGASYATEAGLFEEAGCPAVVCGPGDIAQAHTADEFVAIAQIETCLKFMGDLATRLRT
jgi:acetylornithine deacetylase